MNIFRIQEHVPDVYPRKSRDFQLICNVFDCLQGAVKYDIDAIRDISNTDLCNQRVLNYLQTKLGFFTEVKMSSETQRIILKAFPYVVRNKGSRRGIEQAIQLFLKTQHVSGEIKVTVTNKEKTNGINDQLNTIENVYVVQVAISTKLLDIIILDEILKYIIPAGYRINYIFYNPLKLDTVITEEDAINIIFVEDNVHSGIRTNTNFNDLPINTVSTTRVVKSHRTDPLVINRADTITQVITDTDKQYTDIEGVKDNAQ